MSERPPFVLTGEDRNSDLWRRLLPELERRLSEARVRNDEPSLTQDQTAMKRGEIAVLKALIRLNTPRPVTEQD